MMTKRLLKAHNEHMICYFSVKKIGSTNTEVTLRGGFSQRCNVNF